MMRYFLILCASFISLSAHSFQWEDLWSTPDQQGRDLMAKKHFNEAKETFTRKDWAAAANYRAKDYQKAAELYQELNNEQGNYNQGNALAHLGRYENAIKAYNKALSKNPNNQDALDNRKLVEDLLKQQQQDKDKQDKDKQDKDEQDKDKQDKETDREKQQAKEQWLRLIPDDPGGLMKEKFLRDHIRRQNGWYQ